MATMNGDRARQSAPDATSAHTGPQFISCCPEELVEVEIEGMRQGREQARTDAAGAMHDMRAIGQAAMDACEQALAEKYLPLDEAKFRDVFTLAWCAGYRSEVAESARHRG